MSSLFSAQASDCDIAIGGAALLDKLLSERLSVALGGSQEAQDRLLNPTSRRRDLAYCLGLISEVEYQDLAVIGNVRNRMAHDYPTPTFGSEVILTLVGRLSGWQGESSAARAVFTQAVEQLVQGLGG